jgi:PDDEXK-like domain of unknown function (DUF3799)
VSIQSRVPRDEYDAINAMNITRLKELRRSPLHFLMSPKTSDAMTLGIATHVAVLEPERFGREFSIWDRKTDTGRNAPRNGKWWDAFLAANAGKTVLTESESITANEIARAVRNDSTAFKYLESGDPEITMEWKVGGRHCKGRADWLTSIEGKATLVGLKTTRDCRHFAFGAQAAKLGYELQWSWYFDGYETITGVTPRMIEIVVESAPPYAVATYIIDNDVLAQGQDNYRELLRVLAECEESGKWPGPVEGEQILTLPSWFYGELADDISDLGLEGLENDRRTEKAS